MLGNYACMQSKQGGESQIKLPSEGYRAIGGYRSCSIAVSRYSATPRRTFDEQFGGTFVLQLFWANQKSREGGVREGGLAQIFHKLCAKFAQNCRYFMSCIRGRVRKIVANLKVNFGQVYANTPFPMAPSPNVWAKTFCHMYATGANTECTCEVPLCPSSEPILATTSSSALLFTSASAASSSSSQRVLGCAPTSQLFFTIPRAW